MMTGFGWLRTQRHIIEMRKYLYTRSPLAIMQTIKDTDSFTDKLNCVHSCR